MALCRLALLFLAFIAAISAQPLDVMLAVETTFGTEQAIGLMRTASLGEGDRVGLVGFATNAALLQPLTANRDEIESGLQAAGSRLGVGVGSRQAGPIRFPVDVSGALRLAAEQFRQGGDAHHGKVIVLLFAGEDHNLGARNDTLHQMLAEGRIRLYAVLVPRGYSPQPWDVPNGNSTGFPEPSPIMTSQLLGRLAKDSGGKLIKGGWDLRRLLDQARKR